jgi:putative SOS response-associated peptidase YedK
MCGRFTLTTPPEMLAALFELDDLGDWNDPRYNIAPQTRILTVRRAGRGRTAQTLLWGVLNPRGPRPLINARSETAATSPLFAPAFARARVLVPADGFFEWTTVGGKRLAHYFQQPGGGPFAFAGLAVDPPPASGGGEPAAVILTAEASESVRPVHDRMPLIVAREDFDAWLDPAGPLAAARAVITRGGRTVWTSRRVGPLVNNVRNDSPECLRPAGPAADPQGSLF